MDPIVLPNITPDPVQNRDPEKPNSGGDFTPNDPTDSFDNDGWSSNVPKEDRELIEDPENVIEGTAPKFYWDLLTGHRSGLTGYELVDLWNALVKGYGGTAVYPRPMHP